jgi:regulator of sigma E protease
MDVLIQASQFILSLSLLIILHEMGHFLPAKYFKTRVEKFYLFFNPWFSLFKKKIGDTEYGIGWIPLGGYVKISGMIDESMDKEQLKQPAQPWEFRSKPAWQRLIIMLGGVTVNAILGAVIFIGILLYWGETYLRTENAVYGIAVDSLGHEMGLRDGDHILAVDGHVVDNFQKIPYEIIINDADKVQVLRGGQEMVIDIPDGVIGKMIKRKKAGFVMPRFPVKISKVKKGSVAEEAGLLAEDEIVSINGQPTLYFNEFDKAKKEHKGEEIEIGIKRGDGNLTLKATLPDNAILGFQPYMPEHFLKLDTINYSFFQAIPAGISKAYTTFIDYVKQIKLIFVSDEVKASESVGGFIAIGSIFSPEWDWLQFWTMTAWLSIILAFMNLLPIPALDGGHVIFLLWEMISGKEAPQKVLEYSQMVGMILLLSLLVFANANDVIRLFN